MIYENSENVDKLENIDKEKNDLFENYEDESIKKLIGLNGFLLLISMSLSIFLPFSSIYYIIMIVYNLVTISNNHTNLYIILYYSLFKLII